MKTQDILPVILSIRVIVLVAILEKQSKLVAALAATLPRAAGVSGGRLAGAASLSLLRSTLGIK